MIDTIIDTTIDLHMTGVVGCIKPTIYRKILQSDPETATQTQFFFSEKFSTIRLINLTMLISYAKNAGR